MYSFRRPKRLALLWSRRCIFCLFETAKVSSRLVRSYSLFGPHIVHAALFIGPVIAIEQDIRRDFAGLFGVVEKLALQDIVFEIGHAIGFPCSFMLFQGFPLFTTQK